MIWPFKWKLSACTFTWCYLFVKILENEICLWPHLAVKGLSATIVNKMHLTNTLFTLSPCHGSCPFVKYINTYPSDSISSRRLVKRINISHKIAGTTQTGPQKTALVFISGYIQTILNSFSCRLEKLFSKVLTGGKWPGARGRGPGARGQELGISPGYLYNEHDLQLLWKETRGEKNIKSILV